MIRVTIIITIIITTIIIISSSSITLITTAVRRGCQGVAAPAARCVLNRISEGRLPPGLANWPADVEVESTDFIEL